MTNAATTSRRWYHLTPDCFVIGLLAVVCLLWLSERYRWFAFNQHKGWTVLIAVATVAAAMLFVLLWFAVALIFRWRFQFSIRLLMLLVFVVALPCSWLAMELKKAREQDALVNEWKNAGKYALYNYTLDSSGKFLPDATPPAPAWLRKITGDDFFADAIPAKGGGFMSSEILIEGWSHEQVLNWFGRPPTINRSDYSLPSYRLYMPNKVDEQWVYEYGVGHRLIYFTQGKVVLALDESWDF